MLFKMLTYLNTLQFQVINVSKEPTDQLMGFNPLCQTSNYKESKWYLLADYNFLRWYQNIIFNIYIYYRMSIEWKMVETCNHRPFHLNLDLYFITLRSYTVHTWVKEKKKKQQESHIKWLTEVNQNSFFSKLFVLPDLEGGPIPNLHTLSFLLFHLHTIQKRKNLNCISTFDIKLKSAFCFNLKFQ